MKRTTVMLPDDLEARLRREARRREVPIAEIVREAVELHLPAAGPGRTLSFVALGEGNADDDSEHVDEVVARALRRSRGG